MRRLVFATQAVDPADANLGATVAMVAALARRVDEVVVVCDRGVEGVLPGNCRLRVFGAPTRVERARRYLRAIASELRPRPLAFVAHMVPLYALVAAPLVRPRRVPLVLWYTHPRDHAVLRAAAAVSTHLVTADARSFPFRSRKLTATGHAIDPSEFACAPPPAGSPFRVAVLGRYSTGKGLDEIVAGARLARERGADVRLAFAGTAGTPAEEAQRGALERLVADAEWASVGGPVPRTEVPALLEEVDAVAANFDSADKIVYEACAACRPAVASYRGFAPLFAGIEPPLAFERGRPETLADRLVALAALGPDERAAIGRQLRERVARDHSVDAWAGKIVGLVACGS
jgi:glycosyltransferase involved in cell wall biosynthesis